MTLLFLSRMCITMKITDFSDGYLWANGRSVLSRHPRFRGKIADIWEYAGGLGTVPPEGSRGTALVRVRGQSPEKLKAFCCLNS